MAKDSTQNKRPVRSYVIRSGRLTDSQRSAIEKHWHKHVIAFKGKPIDIDSLFVSTIAVDESFTMKRVRARARGRADRYFKRSCNIALTLEEKGK